MPMITDARHDWVDARPFRMHCRRLLAETGLGVTELAVYAGVPPRVLHRLVGVGGRPLRKLFPVSAHRLMRIELHRLREALATPVRADPAVLLVRRLTTAAVPHEQLLAALGGDELTLRALGDGAEGTVLLRQELALSALAVAHGAVTVWCDEPEELGAAGAEPLAA